MQWFQSLLYLALVSSTAIAAPTPALQQKSKIQKRSFKVDVIQRRDYVPNGLAAIRKAQRKFGMIPTHIDLGALDIQFEPGVEREALSKAATSLENGEVQNMPTQNDVQYLSPVTIGGQEFVMNFDTGSADTWVFNTQLDEATNQGHGVFDPKKSTTFKDIEGGTFSIRYGDGSFASGTLGTDTVDIGGATVENQAFGLPNNVSSSFAADEASDGLVGLAFSRLSTMRPERQTTFFEKVAPFLEQPVLAAQLKSGAPGSYEFGTVDDAKFSGDMINVTVDTSRGFWEIPSSFFMIGNGADLQTIQTGVQTAIIDTGTTLMLLNPEVVEAYYAQVEGAEPSVRAGGYVYPCDSERPDLYVSVGDDHLARIPGEDITFARVGREVNTKREYCFGGIQSNEGSSLQIFGDVFLKAIFTVFDLRGPSLGLAAHA
ncbi:hypothetical protein AJ80_08868 [Polytolypa hystricis UAMH7299]|uniref:Peptidase A1 domain-containing protein n=1 Tax=Polytolypa hystricis (strain UAMH7299) TaxID=1447883 RepID=A0A2B7WZW5_POLH7|nr:hypothetical protein AJ80_08868 [Polytolypa hystricis UAMH7299]